MDTTLQCCGLARWDFPCIKASVGVLYRRRPLVTDASKSSETVSACFPFQGASSPTGHLVGSASSAHSVAVDIIRGKDPTRLGRESGCSRM